ncbi:MAG: adenylyltransferase/cytidyltransferase family protein [Anaerolineales bacterium]|nr:adenylyltransferase/cytidyltransferase family protein [Anaerolineales bacterium]
MEPYKNPSFAAILGRWQPVHLGHQAALQSLCSRFDRVVIGIGSSNIHDYRNPFSLAEVKDMLRLSIGNYTNFTLLPIPDIIDDRAWCKEVVNTFGQLEYFITANPYVKTLLDDNYLVSHPANFIPEERKIAVSASMVRRQMAQGGDWPTLVPQKVSQYILTQNLDERFRKEFGLHTLAIELMIV